MAFENKCEVGYLHLDLIFFSNVGFTELSILAKYIFKYQALGNIFPEFQSNEQVEWSLIAY